MSRRCCRWIRYCGCFRHRSQRALFRLLAGSTLGGNLTPIGASANIVGIGILRSVGYTVKTRTFMRIGIPSTLAAVTTAYVLIWLLFGLPV
jgi:Na+/H+ antiporter NhaD/arsenite permease-like protein